MARKRRKGKAKKLTDLVSRDELWEMMQQLKPGEGLRISEDGTRVEKFRWKMVSAKRQI